MRARLLHLSHTLPYPARQGIDLRALNILKLLAREYEVTSLCFYDHRLIEDPDASVDALSQWAVTRAFPMDQTSSRVRLAYDHFRSLATNVAYTATRHSSKAFNDALSRVLRDMRPTVVHLESLCDLAHLLPILGDIPVIATHHNIESELLRRRAKRTVNPLVRRYVDLQAARMEAIERVEAQRIALNMTVSDDDAQVLRERAPSARTVVVPNGVDTTYFRRAETEPDAATLAFVGGLSWHPNRDALEYFGEQCLPRIRDRVPKVRVTWIGAASEHDRRRYTSRFGIDLLGRVDDVRPYLAAATAFIVPLRIGGGTRLKILDAWSSGKAVISTTIGAEGLGATHDHQLLYGDSPASLADAAIAVLSDPLLRRRLEDAGREHVERRFSWDVVAETLLPAVRSATAD